MRTCTRFSQLAIVYFLNRKVLQSKNHFGLHPWPPLMKGLVIIISIWFCITCQLFGQSSDCEPGNVHNGANDLWSEQCYLANDCQEQGNPCQANDVRLLGIFAADANGGSIPTCATSDPVQFYLWGTFKNNTSSNRYAVRTVSELFINNAFQFEINQCSFDQLAPGETQAILLNELTYTCGDQMELKNTWVGWDASPRQCSDPMGNNYDCFCIDYPAAKCSKSLESIAFLVPNFSYACNGMGQGQTHLCITNLTSGGTEPLAYSIDFGDGYISSLPNPCHTYNANSGTYIVTLTATDANGITASAADTITLQELDCCQLTYTCPPANGGLFSCAEDIPSPDESILNATNYCGSLFIDVNDSSIGGGCPADTLFVTRTYYLEDEYSSASCVQVFKVVDNILPSITCPDNITVSCSGQVPLPNLNLITSDNCNEPVTVSFISDITTANMGCPNQFIINRTYSAVDACGNNATCLQAITVFDNIPPVIVCLPDITVSCSSQVPPTSVTGVVASDNCNGPVSVTVSEGVVTDSTCVNQKTITRTFTAVDLCGNTSTCQQVITVNDHNAPSITCPGDLTVTCGGDVPVADISIISAADNCTGSPVITVAPDVTTNLTCSNSYLITRVYTATDACGNSSSCTQNILVHDTIAPFITCPANLTVTCSENIPIPNIGSIGSTDNCNGPVTITIAPDITTNFVCANNYTLQRIYSATDVCGNVATCSQTITVFDSTPPSVNCPANITVTCGSEVPVPDTAAIVSNDNCSGVIIVTVEADDTISFTCMNNYLLERTYHVADACGNSSSCIQSIFVIDTIPPQILCPHDITVLCGEEPDPDPATVVITDNCIDMQIASFVEDDTIGLPCSYQIQRIYQAMDACGNSSTCVQNIFVLDTVSLPASINIEVPDTLIVQCFGQDTSWQVPQLDIHDITIEGGCNFPDITHTTTITYSENCAEDGYIAIYNRIYTAVDTCGNMDSDTLILMLVDTIPPVIHGIPDDITVSADSIPLTPEVYATDECLCACVILTEETGQGSGCLDNTVITRSWTATDQCGNQTHEVQHITVHDQSGPKISLSLPGMNLHDGDLLTFTCESGGIPAMIRELDLHSVTDQDASLPIHINFITDSTRNANCEFTGFLEEHTYTWEALDGCGNNTEFSFTARLSDHQAPMILAVPDTACIDDPLLDLVDAQDNCSAVSLRFWDVAMKNPCGDGTAFRRTYEASDACGNIAVDTAILIPDDHLPPVLYFINPDLIGLQEGDTIDVECNSTNGHYTSFGAKDIGISDNCPGGIEITYSEDLLSNGDCLHDRTLAFVKLNWLGTDQCGNQSKLSLIGQIKDHTPPSLVDFLPDISVSCNDLIKDVETTDNCGTVTIYNQDSILAGPCLYKYDIKRLIIATDQCGNTATFSQLIHVGDDGGPRLSGIEKEVCDNLSMPLVTAFDVCADVTVGVSMVQDTLDDTCADGVVITRVWTAVDLCGDTTSITQRIILGDTIAPHIIIPANSFLQKMISGDSIVIVYLSQTNMMNQLSHLDGNSVIVLDNCDQEIDPLFQVAITQSPNAQADGFMEQRYYYWTATDICGNKASMSFTVRIVDDVPPVAELPGDTVIYCSPLPPPASMIPGDNPENIQVTYTQTITDGEEHGEFIVTRTWIMTDMSGNVTTVIQHIRWIPDTFIACNIVPPHEVSCNSHDVVVGSDITGGIGPFTYYWVVTGEECFIQAGQETPEIHIYVGWAPVNVILYVTDAHGCTTSCETTITCEVGSAGFVGNSAQPGSPMAESNDAVYVWPNPTQGELGIRFNFSKKQICNITFVNFLGETALQQKIEIGSGASEYHLDLSGLPDGPYFMDIQSGDYHSSRNIMLLNNK